MKMQSKANIQSLHSNTSSVGAENIVGVYSVREEWRKSVWVRVGEC
jgi:hypothetical protein